MADFSQAVSNIESAGTANGKEDYEQKMQAWQKSVYDKDSGYGNGKPLWAMNNADISSWQKMTLPTTWENASLPNFDGVVWFHKKIMIPASWAGKDIKVTLGPIDDIDITWFNGEKIGETEGYTEPRVYTIAGKSVKEGENETGSKGI